MPKPPTKDKNQKQNIVGKALKDIIPSSYPHIQDLKEIEYPPQGEKVYSPENLPIELYPEWPSNETDLENNEINEEGGIYADLENNIENAKNQLNQVKNQNYENQENLQ